MSGACRTGTETRETTAPDESQGEKGRELAYQLAAWQEAGTFYLPVDL